MMHEIIRERSESDMEETMKALVYNGPGKYGLTNVPVPVILKPTDVIAKVTLAAICPSDIHQVRGEIADAVYPRIQGPEFCAEVVETGSGVKNLKAGDRCMVLPGTFCGQCDMCRSGRFILCRDGGIFGNINMEGCHAEYIRIPRAEQTMFPIPEGLTEEDVIMLPDMLATGWFGITNAGFTEGGSVAVIGVGPVGQCACLLAKKAFSARQVIAVDTLQYRLDIAKNAGNADVVINPAQDKAVKKLLEATGGAGVDLVIETAGIKATFDLAVRAAKMNGIISTVAVPAAPFEVNMPSIVFRNLTIKAGIQNGAGIRKMMKMIMAGKIDSRFLLTHRAPLNDIEKGYDVFGNQKNNCMKWLITPYER